MSAATWRFAVWRVMGRRGRCAPLGLVCARLRPWIQLERMAGPRGPERPASGFCGASGSRSGPRAPRGRRRRGPRSSRGCGRGSGRPAWGACGPRRGSARARRRSSPSGPGRRRGRTCCRAWTERLRYSLSNDHRGGSARVLSDGVAGDRARPEALGRRETRQNRNFVSPSDPDLPLSEG